MLIFTLIRRLLSPRSLNLDLARREFILNVLLFGSLFITVVAFFKSFLDQAIMDATSPQILFFFFMFILFLYYLSRKGKIQLASLILIFFLYLSSIYTSIRWGADVTQAWLMYALVIVMSGILIGTRFAFFLTLSLVIFVSCVSYLQITNIYQPSVAWRLQSHTFGDTILLNITIIVIAVIAWLSNREIEKSLKRAQKSERELKKERDLLEIKVEERTQELKRIQLEKVTQLYRFAEIGRMTSGFMHDLVSPISLISLNLHNLNRQSQQQELSNIKILLKRALIGTRYLENFISTARKQLQNQDVQKTFSLNHEIKQIIQMLTYRANKLGVKVTLEANFILRIYGDQIKFNQIMMNLISNAIDSYYTTKNNGDRRKVIVSLNQTTEKDIIITLQDWGCGILPENIKKIFDPFFTTKPMEQGTGIGLSITQEIIRQNFSGKLLVKSSPKNGTTFTVKIPKRYPTLKHPYETRS